jgi:hypothetical protein
VTTDVALEKSSAVESAHGPGPGGMNCLPTCRSDVIKNASVHIGIRKSKTRRGSRAAR